MASLSRATAALRPRRHRKRFPTRRLPLSVCRGSEGRKSVWLRSFETIHVDEPRHCDQAPTRLSVGRRRHCLLGGRDPRSGQTFSKRIPSLRQQSSQQRRSFGSNDRKYVNLLKQLWIWAVGALFIPHPLNRVYVYSRCNIS